MVPRFVLRARDAARGFDRGQNRGPQRALGGGVQHRRNRDAGGDELGIGDILEIGAAMDIARLGGRGFEQRGKCGALADRPGARSRWVDRDSWPSSHRERMACGCCVKNCSTSGPICS